MNREANLAFKFRVFSFPSQEGFMAAATAVELRAEAARLREFARTVTDPYVLAEIEKIAGELERRARAMSNGGASSDKAI